ncbi:MAG: Fic family protein [Christensenellaceae bacterium]|jgi:Fic family protein|nr:Fic family protein [Christensenellaceae bacterium]
MEFEYTPKFTLNNEMLLLVAEIMNIIGGIHPIDDLSKQPILRKINRIKTIHSSLAIENNSLTLEQVTAVINGKTVLAPQNEIQEVKNAYEAYKLLGIMNPFEVKDMLKVHGIMLQNLIADCGKLRTKNVGVYQGGMTVHIAPPPENVSALIYKLYDWLKKDKTHPLIKSCVFHYEFEFIHPFDDGNGRLGRFMQSAILHNWNPIFAWLPIETIIKERQQEYYNCFEKARIDGEPNVFIVFILQAILDALKNLQIESNKFLLSQTVQIQRLMNVLDARPVSAKTITELLKLKSVLTVKRNYLEPAIKLGLVQMTEPNNPTSRNQKYFRS